MTFADEEASEIMEIRSRISSLEGQLDDFMLAQDALISQATQLKSVQEMHARQVTRMNKLVFYMQDKKLEKIESQVRRELLQRRKSKVIELWRQFCSEGLKDSSSEAHSQESTVNLNGHESHDPQACFDDSSMAQNDEQALSRKIRLKFMRQRIRDVEEEFTFIEFLNKIKKCDIMGLSREFTRNILGIRVRNAVRGISGSRLIDPQSPFNSAVQVLSTLLLTYSVFLVPVQLSFWDHDDPCVVYVTLYFDMMADVFFMLELHYYFFVGISDARGSYVDTLADVAYIQLTNPWLFWFNLFTSIPISWIDWHVSQLCVTYGSVASVQGWGNLAILRSVKPVRLLKLIRLLRASKIYTALADVLDVNPLLPRVFKIFFVLVLAVHFSACLVWRVKKGDEENLDSWLSGHGTPLDDTRSAYILSVYCVVTIYTTVGLGDITAVNMEERILFVFLMLFAAFLFGILIGELQEMFANLNQAARDLDDYIQGMTLFLRRNHISRALHRKFRTFVRFKFSFDRSHSKVEEILGILPPNLRSQLASSLNAGTFSRVPLFQRIRSSADRAFFSAALLPRVRSATLPAGTLLAHHREVADRLVVIAAGRIAMHLPREVYDNATETDWLRVLGPGEAFGDLSVLGDPRWAGAYGVHADFTSIEDVHVTFIRTADILDVLSGPIFAPIKAALDASAGGISAHATRAGAVHQPPPLAELSMREIRATYRWSLLVLLARQRPGAAGRGLLASLVNDRGLGAASLLFPKDSVVLFPLMARRPSSEQPREEDDPAPIIPGSGRRRRSRR